MKVSEIRPDGLMAGQEAAMQEDIDWLAARKEAFVEVACPACGASAGRLLYEKYGMRHQLCTACATQYVSPRPTAETLGAFYAESVNYRYWAKEIFPASREKRRAGIFQPRAAIVAELVRRHGIAGGVLVEVGAAHGLFCDEIRKLDLFTRLIAIEPTPDMANECRALGFETIEAPWERVRLDQPAQVMAAFEVIEHLFDPGAFLRWCHANLLADGHVLFTCPNIAGFETMLLGKASGAVDHEHINLFTPDSLCRLINASGFQVIERSTPGELDVDLVRRALEAGDLNEDSLGPVVSRLVRHSDRDVATRLQDLLKRAGLSSNMMVLARKCS
jgi:hypothetical protein